MASAEEMKCAWERAAVAELCQVLLREAIHSRPSISMEAWWAAKSMIMIT